MISFKDFWRTLSKCLKKKIIRIIGLIGLISYTGAILYDWISENLGGIIYFPVGEPTLIVKYPEWMLGIVGIVVAVDLLINEIYRLRREVLIDIIRNECGEIK